MPPKGYNRHMRAPMSRVRPALAAPTIVAATMMAYPLVPSLACRNQGRLAE
jgi:hypothetical protein